MNNAKNKYIKEIVRKNKEVIREWKQVQDMKGQFIKLHNI